MFHRDRMASWLLVLATKPGKVLHITTYTDNHSLRRLHVRVKGQRRRVHSETMESGHQLEHSSRHTRLLLRRCARTHSVHRDHNQNYRNIPTTPNTRHTRCDTTTQQTADSSSRSYSASAAAVRHGCSYYFHSRLLRSRVLEIWGDYLKGR